MTKETVIAIAGATGFVGKNLIKHIEQNYDLIGLSRRQQKSTDNIEWRCFDLFSYQSTSKALEGADIVIYLVHSMLPASKLFQGTFQDTDLFIADNFARACKHNDIKQIIYLGGISPDQQISKHLESRKEVERVFKGSGIPTTILRAGMVVGNGGSSFEILKNLVLNLPVMVLPKWTQSDTQLIYIDDLVKALAYSIGNEELYNKTLNVVNGEKISYKDLIEQASEHFSKNKKLISVPINYLSFSKLWVKVFGNADYELVSPLVDSLVCSFADLKLSKELEGLIEYPSFKSMLPKIAKEKTKRRKRTQTADNTVRSIQRISRAKHLNVEKLSDSYIEWLNQYMSFLIKVESKDNIISVKLRFFGLPLLILQKQLFNKDLDRVKFHIVGGLLTNRTDIGWLEFRKACGVECALVSINDFVPSLPWYVYKNTQAILHLIAMKNFDKFLYHSR